MRKDFCINGRKFAVVSYISDEHCYRLIALSDNDDINEGKILIDNTACDDFYGDIDDVTENMKEYIREEAKKPYPYWTLMGALYEWGSDPRLIEDEEEARSFAEVLDCATISPVDKSDEYEFKIAKERLNLEDNEEVAAIYTFVNGSYGSFALAEDW